MLSGLAASIIQIINFVRQKWAWLDTHISPKVFHAITVACLIGGVWYAGFQAWHGEHALRLIAEDAIKTAEAAKKDAETKLFNMSPSGQQEAIDELKDEIVQLKNQKVLLLEGKPDRHLKEEEKKLLRENLLKIVSKMPQIFTAAPGQPEPQQYLEEIAEVFRDAGIKVENESPIFFTSTQDNRGLFVGVRDEKTPPPLAKLLKETLEKSGLNVQYGINKLSPQEYFNFIVGDN
mgnify:FL=1